MDSFIFNKKAKTHTKNPKLYSPTLTSVPECDNSPPLKKEPEESGSWDDIFNESNVMNTKRIISEIDITDINKKSNVYDCEVCGYRLRNLDEGSICDKCGLISQVHISDTQVSTDLEVEGMKLSVKNGLNSQKLIYQPGSNNIQSSNNKLKNEWKFSLENTIIPKQILESGSNMAMEIKGIGTNKRGDQKKGLYAAIISTIASTSGYALAPEETAELMKIKKSHQSNGYKIIRELVEIGKIQKFNLTNCITEFTCRFLKILDIPQHYSKFIVELISRAEQKKLYVIHECCSTTKCAGAIYMLVTRVKELRHITKEDIQKKLKISITTFKKYYTLILCNYYLLFKVVFKRHKIPMPKIWKVDKYSSEDDN